MKTGTPPLPALKSVKLPAQLRERIRYPAPAYGRGTRMSAGRTRSSIFTGCAIPQLSAASKSRRSCPDRPIRARCRHRGTNRRCRLCFFSTARFWESICRGWPGSAGRAASSVCRWWSVAKKWRSYAIRREHMVNVVSAFEAIVDSIDSRVSVTLK